MGIMENFLKKSKLKIISWYDAIKARFSVKSEKSREQRAFMRTLKQMMSSCKSYGEKSRHNLTEFEILSRKYFNNMPPQIEDSLITRMIQVLSTNLQVAWDHCSVYTFNMDEVWDVISARLKDLLKTMRVRDDQYVKVEVLDKKLKKSQAKLAKVNALIPTEQGVELTAAQQKLKAEAAVLSAKIVELSQELYAQINLFKEHDEKVKQDLDMCTEVVHVACTIYMIRVTMATTTFHKVLNDKMTKEILPNYVDYCNNKLTNMPNNIKTLITDVPAKSPDFEDQNFLKNKPNQGKLKVSDHKTSKLASTPGANSPSEITT